MKKNNPLPYLSLLTVLVASTFMATSLNLKEYAAFAGEIGDINDMARMPTMTLYGDTKTSMAFTWNTTNYNDSDLQVVKKSDGDFIHATSFTGTIEHSQVANDKFIHRAIATGLEADTEYLYRFGDIELQTFTEVGEFKTSSSNNKDFRIVHLSDPQGWQENHYEGYHDVLKSIDKEEKPNWLALTGDIVNNSWAEHTPVLEQWEWALTDQWDILKNYPIAPVSGNHDAASNDFNSRYTLDKPNGSSVDSGTYYSFDYEGVHFVGLNTNDTLNVNAENASGISDEQYNWLVSDLQSHKNARYLVIMMHKGIFDSGSHSTNNSGEDFDIAYIRAQLAPLFSKYGVDLVLQGHDHLYSLTYPIYSTSSGGTSQYNLDDTYKTTKDTLLGEEMDVFYNLKGTFYLNSGSASGSKYYVPQNADDATFHIYKTEGLTTQCYTAIDFTNEAIILRTYIMNGEKRTPYYSFAISSKDYSSDDPGGDDDPIKPQKQRVNVVLIVSLSVGGTLVIGGGLLAFILIRRRRK